MAQEAASSGSSQYPEPEERGYFIADLFAKAAYFDAASAMAQGEIDCALGFEQTACRSPAINTLPAHCVDAEYPDTIVYGLHSHPDKVRVAGENCC